MSAKRWSPALFADAWDFAARHHHGQTYGGPRDGERVEYLQHVGRVAAEVMWALGDADDPDLAVACALLHDVLEDTPATFSDVAARFGTAVAEGVRALTKDESLPDSRARMEDSLRRIRAQPREVWMVKLADRIANLAGPPYYWDAGRTEAYRAEAVTIHAALHAASPALAARLAERIERYPSPEILLPEQPR